MLLVAAGPGLAADHDWSGSYAGISIGYAADGRDRVSVNPPGTIVGTLITQGPLVAVSLGQNWQNGRTLWGIEAELMGGGIGSDVSDGTIRAATNQDYSAGLRLRLGFLQEESLFYIAGGVELARFGYSVTGGGAAIDTKFSTQGYTIGAGWEQELTDDWSVRAEYRYSTFDSKVLTDGTVTTKATPVYHSVRLGLTTRF